MSTASKPKNVATTPATKAPRKKRALTEAQKDALRRAEDAEDRAAAEATFDEPVVLLTLEEVSARYGL